MMRRRARGFTLVEVLVAVVLTALAATLAARTWAAVAGGAASAGEAREALDREVNAHRWLGRAFRSLEVDPIHRGFEGERDRVRFATWLERAEGWLEPGRVELAARGGVLLARLPAESIILAREVAGVELDYLLEPGATTRWAGRWVSPVSAPLAIRLRVLRIVPAGSPTRVDTLLFLVGERG
jgi:prepilin-type N-terminal cleavage/methylation domain-containing protein